MTVINPTADLSTPGKQSVTWANLGADCVGAGVQPNPGDALVQIIGSLSGATCIIEGSLDGSTWFPLHDRITGSLLQLSSPALKVVAEPHVLMRPRIENGQPDTSVAVLLMVAT
jgi:hypothetical protein